MKTITLHVHGLPAPQGSKSGRAIYRGRGNDRVFTGKVAMHESSKKVAPWRQAVKATALNTIALHTPWTPFNKPVHVTIHFRFPRPKNHYRTGKYAHLLKPDAPLYATSRAAGDIEKLVRSCGDALTDAGIWVDDSLVASLETEKRYVNDPTQAGATITIEDLLLPRQVECVTTLDVAGPDFLALLDP